MGDSWEIKCVHVKCYECKKDTIIAFAEVDKRTRQILEYIEDETHGVFGGERRKFFGRVKTFYCDPCIHKLQVESQRQRAKYLKRDPDTGKIVPEEFVKHAIMVLREYGAKGIHTVKSGFNEAYRTYYGEEPTETLNRLIAEKIVIVEPALGGRMIYLASDVHLLDILGLL